MVIELVTAALSVGAALAAAVILRQTLSVKRRIDAQLDAASNLEVAADVEEIAKTVERLATQARREQMRRVRAASAEAPGSPPELAKGAQPDLPLGLGPNDAPASSDDPGVRARNKHELRLKLMRRAG